jgi:hypothetical protein
MTVGSVPGDTMVNMPHGSMEFCTSIKDLRRIVSVKPGLVLKLDTRSFVRHDSLTGDPVTRCFVTLRTGPLRFVVRLEAHENRSKT